MFKKLLPAILVLASQAWATTSYYVGQTADNSLFNDLTPSSINFITATSGTTLADVGGSGVSFSGFYGTTPHELEVDGQNATFIATGTLDSIRISFPSDIRAFLIGVTTELLAGDWCFGAADQFCPSAQTQTVPIGSTIYFGVVSDAPLVDQVFTVNNTSKLILKDFVVGKIDSVEAIPEPSTMALFGGSLVALAVMARRRKQAQAPRPTAEP